MKISQHSSQKNDEIGIIGSANGWNGNPLSWLQNMFIYCDNTDDRFMVVDGELDVSYDKEAYREFLIYARRLCDEKLLDPLSFTQEYNAAFLPQVTAEELQVAIAICGGVGGFGSNISHYQAAEVIEGPDGYKASTFTPSSGAIASTSAYITCAAESPEACFAFLMIGFSDADYPIIARYGQQGLDWDYCADGEVGLYDALGYPAVFKWLRGDIRSIAGQTSVWGGANVTTLPYQQLYRKIGERLKEQRFHTANSAFVYPHPGDAPAAFRCNHLLRMLSGIIAQIVFKAAVIHAGQYVNHRIGAIAFVQPGSVSLLLFFFRQTLQGIYGVGTLQNDRFFHTHTSSLLFLSHRIWLLACTSYCSTVYV